MKSLETHVGFTGTQIGMNDKQLSELRMFMETFRGPTVGHHGDCIGADAQFHELCKEEFLWRVEIHPPDNDSKRAFCTLNLSHGDVLHLAKPYLERNKDIVDACSILAVTPKEEEEQLRSGTWSTYRYANKTYRDYRLITP